MDEDMNKICCQLGTVYWHTDAYSVVVRHGSGQEAVVK